MILHTNVASYVWSDVNVFSTFSSLRQLTGFLIDQTTGFYLTIRLFSNKISNIAKQGFSKQFTIHLNHSTTKLKWTKRWINEVFQNLTFLSWCWPVRTWVIKYRVQWPNWSLIDGNSSLSRNSISTFQMI